MKHSMRYALFGAAIGWLVNCNNYGLLEKFQSPDSSAQERLYAFVSSVTTSGASFSDYSAGLFSSCSVFAGQGRADCACQIMAQNAGLPMPKSGRYISWTSISTNDMRCRMQGIFNSASCATLPSGGPIWQNTHGVSVANGYAGLFSGNLMSALNVTETKVAPGNTNVYTGTNPDGTLTGAIASATCTDWSSGTGATLGLSTALGAQWTNNTTSPNCSTVASIYCFALP